MLFTTLGLNKFISGVILFDETIRRKIGSASIPECVFGALTEHRVVLEAMLLKTSMVLSDKSDKDCPQQADVNVVAVATLRCLR